MIKKFKGHYFKMLKSGSAVYVEKLKGEWYMSIEIDNGGLEKCGVFNTLKDAKKALELNIQEGKMQ